MYKFTDNILRRIVQIVQEAMITGVDCVDLMRQIEVKPNDAGMLELTPEYQLQVRETHQKLLERAEEIKNEG